MACTKHSSQANCIHLSVFESSFATIIQAQRVIFLLETTCNTFPVDKANCRLRQYGSSIFIPTVFLFAPYFHAYCRDSPSGHRLWRLHCHTNSADLDLDCNLNFDMPKTLHGSRGQDKQVCRKPNGTQQRHCGVSLKHDRTGTTEK